nr:hypothetical protein CTI12_AA255210 [Tanacetum cinerariifolium]
MMKANCENDMGAKLKLGFINGGCVMPQDGSEELRKWIRCDYMVTYWIFSSMTAEISKAQPIAKIVDRNY